MSGCLLHIHVCMLLSSIFQEVHSIWRSAHDIVALRFV